MEVALAILTKDKPLQKKLYLLTDKLWATKLLITQMILVRCQRKLSDVIPMGLYSAPTQPEYADF